MSGPFWSLRRVLCDELGEFPSGRSNGGVWVDLEREARTGIPEIVLAEGKTSEQLVTGVRLLLESHGRALVSRLRREQYDLLVSRFEDVVLRSTSSGRTVVFRKKGYEVEPNGGRVGILTAGAGDRPTAEEAQLVVEELGCEVRVAFDVGVAGLHRLVPALEEVVSRWDADVLIVAAGMDGVLPTVVAGLVDIPVIGLPTPVGYGVGGEGVAALQSMLQSCAPGLVVVNIDNGIGAGAAAAKIAMRCARLRRGLVKGLGEAGEANREFTQ